MRHLNTIVKKSDLRIYYENALKVAEEAVIKAEIIVQKSLLCRFAHLFPDYVNTFHYRKYAMKLTS